MSTVYKDATHRKLEIAATRQRINCYGQYINDEMRNRWGISNHLGADRIIHNIHFLSTVVNSTLVRYSIYFQEEISHKKLDRLHKN